MGCTTRPTATAQAENEVTSIRKAARDAQSIRQKFKPETRIFLLSSFGDILEGLTYVFKILIHL
jgi:hypothetical protein